MLNLLQINSKYCIYTAPYKVKASAQVIKMVMKKDEKKGKKKEDGKKKR